MEDPNVRQRVFWTEWAEKYGDELASVHRYGDIKELEKIVVHIIERLEIKQNDAVLDAGCGSGIFLSILKKLTDAKVMGMDFSLKHLQIMKQKSPYIESVNGDVTALPFKNASFDKIVCYSVLHFVDSWKVAVKELTRVAKRGGRIILGDIPDRSKRWKLFIITMKKSARLLAHPAEFKKKIKYAAGGPEWHWFDVAEVLSFIDSLGYKAKILRQPVNLQWGTESYEYRVDLLIDV